jgi:hypothetical protein
VEVAGALGVDWPQAGHAGSAPTAQGRPLASARDEAMA